MTFILFRKEIILTKVKHSFFTAFISMILFFNTYSYALPTPIPFRFIQEAAKEGDAQAQLLVGIAYDKGDPLEKDHDKAVYWYLKAADQGNAKAQYNLALSYEHGEGIEQDKEMAFFWYTKAAEQNNSNAQNNLAVMYQYGEGTNANIDKALYWYKKAAENGNAQSQFNLASFYLTGKGMTTPDKIQAFAWFHIAFENGNEDSSTYLIRIWKTLNNDEKHQARKLANQYDMLYFNYDDNAMTK